MSVSVYVYVYVYVSVPHVLDCVVAPFCGAGLQIFGLVVPRDESQSGMMLRVHFPLQTPSHFGAHCHVI